MNAVTRTGQVLTPKEREEIKGQAEAAANDAAAGAPLQLGYDSRADEPLVQFRDGSVARQSEVDAMLDELEGQERADFIARILGLAPQPADGEPSTSLGAAPQNAQAQQQAPQPPIDAPDYGTELGAGRGFQPGGIPYAPEFDTGNLRLADPDSPFEQPPPATALDRARLAQEGAYPVEATPAPVLDTRTLSQKLGLDPSAGPLSAGAALAVDSGAAAPLIQQPALVDMRQASSSIAGDGESVRQANAPKGGRVLQNRNRSSVASVRQMNSIASKPDYLLAGQSNTMDSGAPVVFGDMPGGAVAGRALAITDSGGRRYSGQYAVVEAADVLTSNAADGTPNPSYAEGVGGKLRAVAGNGRAAGLTEGYRRGTAQQYRQELADDAGNLGIDPAAIQGMKHPMLVRIMPESEVTNDIGDRSNTQSGLEMGVAEQANTDLSRGLLSAVQFDVDGNISGDTIRNFIQALPVTEQGGMWDSKRNPTKQAIGRVRAAAFQQAYGNDLLTEKAFEAADDESLNLLAALGAVSGPLSELAGTEFDIRGDVAQAAEALINARIRGKSAAEFVQSREIFDENPRAYVVMDFFAGNIRDRRTLVGGLTNWVNLAKSEQAKVEQNALLAEQGDDLFGEVPQQSVMSMDELFEELKNATRQAQQARQGTPTRRAAGAAQDSEPQAARGAREAGDARDGRAQQEKELIEFARHAPTEELANVPARLREGAAQKLLIRQALDEGLQPTQIMAALEDVGGTPSQRLKAMMQGEVSAPAEDFALGQQTAQELRERQEAQEARDKAEQRAQERADKAAAEEELKKEVARRSEAAADTFELGQSAEDNLSGQVDIFASTPEAAKQGQEKPKSVIEKMKEGKAKKQTSADKASPFGEVFAGYTNNPEGAITKLMQEKRGEVADAFIHPELGPIAFVYGNEAMGLRHIEAKRGMTWVNRIPYILRHGEFVEDADGLPRAYLVSRDEGETRVTVIRLDWNGQAKTWLVTTYPDHDGKFGGGDKTSRTAADESGLVQGNPSQSTPSAIVPDSAQAGNKEGAVAQPPANYHDKAWLGASNETREKWAVAAGFVGRGGQLNVQGKALVGSSYWKGFNPEIQDKLAKVMPQAKAPKEEAPVVAGQDERAENTFIESPNGGLDYGEITPEMAKAMRRQAGKIRLQQGVQNADGTGWGLAHIEANHGEQIRGAGFDSVQAFVQHIAGNFNEVLQATKGRQLLVTVSAGRKDVMFVQLEPAETGDFYRINTAFAASRDYLEKQERKGAKVLWSGSEPRTTSTRQKSQYADNSDVQSGQSAPIAEAENDSTSVAQESKPNQEKTTAIEDFGEKLEGARKDLPPSLRDEVSGQDIASQPLSKIWPANAHEAIEDDEQAAFAFAARAALPAKPRQVFKLTRWVNLVKEARSLLGQLAAGDLSLAELEREAAKGFDLKPKMLLAKARLLAQLPRESWERVGQVEELPDARRPATNEELAAQGVTKTEDGQWVQNNRVLSYPEVRSARFVVEPLVRVDIDGKTHWLSGVGKIGPDEVQRVQALLGTAAPEKVGSLRGILGAIDFELRYGRNRTVLTINRKGDPERRSLKTFEGADKAAVEQARAWLNGNVPELAAAWEAVKARDNVGKSDVRGKENRKRTGKDWRSGKDATPEMFDAAFQFRGVQFGNWVGQTGAKNRQEMLNDAYDALHDLADMLGLPTQAMSVGGELGLAFGARGSGKFSAHFEPGQVVINLTKTRGAGTLAHEWFHALDNYFRRQRGDASEGRENRYITYKPEAAWVPAQSTRRATAPMTSAQLSKWLQSRFDGYEAGKPLEENAKAAGFVRDPKHKEGVRPQVEAAFAELVQALNDSPMAKRASALDKAADGYWGRIIERGARSFENHVIHKMAEHGLQNDYLANVTDPKAWEMLGKNPERYPYLTAQEQAPISAAFDKLFDTIETRQEDGKTVLFNRKQATLQERKKSLTGFRGSASPVSNADIDALVERFNRSVEPFVGHGNSQAAVARPAAAVAIVARTWADMPAAVREHAAKSGYDNTNKADRILGAQWHGNMYLVQENISSVQEAEETLLHERVHQVLHNNANDKGAVELRKALNQLYLRVGGGEGLMRMAQQAGVDLKDIRKQAAHEESNKRNALVMEEFLATLDGDRAYENFSDKVKRALQEFVGALRNWLRNNGFTALANRLGANLDAATLSDVRAMLKGMRQQELGTGHDAVRFLRVWHGTPHRGIEQEGFKLNKIGTGEGMQAYGHGIYFAEAKNVAESYRKRLTELQRTATTEERQTMRGLERDILNAEATISKVQPGIDAGGIWENHNANGVLMGISQTDKEGYTFRPYSRQKMASLKKQLAQAQAKLEASEQAYRSAERLLALRGGQLYGVDIPEGHELLDWDKPLSEQPQKVREALEKSETMSNALTELLIADYAKVREIELDEARHLLSEPKAMRGMKAWGGDFEGHKIYRALAKYTGSPQAASGALRDAGIPGLRYLDGGSRTAGEGTHNFVIWDESRLTPEAAQIEPMYSRKQAAGQSTAAQIRSAIEGAYGKLLGKLEAKGRVTLTQTLEEAVDAAAKARAAMTGQSVAAAKRGLMASVSASMSATDSVAVNIRRGREALAKAINEQTTVHRAMFRNGLGWVDFVWGDVGTIKPSGKAAGAMGLAHIAEARARKDGMNGMQVRRLMNDIVAAIADGHEFDRKTVGNSTRVGIESGNTVVWMAQRKGSNAWVVTGYEKSPSGAGAGRATPAPTNSLASRTRTAEEGDNGIVGENGTDVKFSANGEIEGFFDRKTGKSFLIADGLSAKDAAATLMHEVGIHMAADGAMGPVFARAQELLDKESGAFFDRVRDRMLAAGETSAEEAAAYIVTEYEKARTNAPKSVQQFVQDLYAAVRAWLYRNGWTGVVKAESLSAADIAAIARANARSLSQAPALESAAAKAAQAQALDERIGKLEAFLKCVSG